MNTTNDPRGGKTSASNALPDSLCRWRFKMQQGLESRSTADSTFGDHVHEALAKESPEGLTLSEADIYESCAAILAAKLAEFFGDTTGMVCWSHRRFWARFSASIPERGLLEHSGEVDRICRKGNRIFICDYKTLAGDQPESPSNLQLRDLACLAAKELIADEVGVCVIQPLVTHSPEITLYTAPDLARAREEMYRRVEDSNFPTGEPTPGEVQCKYCRAKEKCLQYAKYAGGGVPAMLSLLDVPVSSWSPEQRAAFCDRRAVAQKWLDETLEFMEEGAMSDPNFIPGYAMVPGSTVESISEPQLVFERFLKLGGQAERFVRMVKVPKGRLEEEVSELTKCKGKKLKEHIKALCDGATTSKANKASLKKVNK